jgi:hypothetical protein
MGRKTDGVIFFRIMKDKKQKAEQRAISLSMTKTEYYNYLIDRDLANVTGMIDNLKSSKRKPLTSGYPSAIL